MTGRRAVMARLPNPAEALGEPEAHRHARGLPLA
jgi:hypothetical protein